MNHEGITTKMIEKAELEHAEIIEEYARVAMEDIIQKQILDKPER